MVFKMALVAGLVVAFAAGALAHQGVTNPAVKARMDAMSGIGAATKVLGDMAKGTTPFNQDAAQSAAAEIAALAKETPVLFKDPEEDAMSEALPAIWQNFDDFSKKAAAMESAAQSASQSITDLATLRAGLGQIGQTCKACHSDYRK